MNGAGRATIVTARVAPITLVMCCLFAANGAVMPYLGRWLEVERGLSGDRKSVV